MSNYTIDPKTIEIAAKKHEAAAKNREAIKSERKSNRHAAELTYKTVEASTKFVETMLGDATSIEMTDKGTTKAAQGVRIKPVSEISKACMANHTKLADVTTIINVPSVSLDGTKLTRDERAMALYLALRQDNKRLVPIATMSSLKEGTVYAIEQKSFEEWAAHYNREKDGRKFATYAGLPYSDNASEPIEFEATVVSAGTKDGNCNALRASIPDSWWLGYNGGQFRLSEVIDGYPVVTGKGTMNLFKKGSATPEFNDSQVKMVPGGRKVLGYTGKFLVAPCDTTARMSKVWMSAEPLLSLRDVPAVRQFMASRTQLVVSDLLSLLTENNRALLSERLGGLQLTAEGNLMPELRAVLDLLNSNVPWCFEIESRITRFMTGMIAEAVIPSAGIECWESLLVMDDDHGAKMLKHPGKDATAEELDAFMSKVRAMMFRIPHMGAENTVYLDRDPFVKGVGMVVESAVATALDGDADGDRARCSYDKEVIAMFAGYTNWETVGTYKPTKTRIECPLNADMMEDFILQQWDEAWMVGGLTIAAWKLWQIGDYTRGTRMASLAKFSPMTMKHDIMLDDADGVMVPFKHVVNAEYGAVRDELKNIHLQWHEMAEKAAEWKSPRELATAKIANELSALDACWNAGVTAAKYWAENNPMLPLSMTAVKRLVFDAGNRPTSQEWMAAREMITEWAEYWTPIMAAGGPKQGQKHLIFDRARDWARNASRGTLAAMLMWMPKNTESDGFGLKFHTVFASGRGTEVLGLHPQIANFLIEKRNWAQDEIKRMAMVDAMVDVLFS